MRAYDLDARAHVRAVDVRRASSVHVEYGTAYESQPQRRGQLELRRVLDSGLPRASAQQAQHTQRTRSRCGDLVTLAHGRGTAGRGPTLLCTTTGLCNGSWCYSFTCVQLGVNLQYGSRQTVGVWCFPCVARTPFFLASNERENGTRRVHAHGPVHPHRDRRYSTPSPPNS